MKTPAVFCSIPGGRHTTYTLARNGGDAWAAGASSCLPPCRSGALTLIPLSSKVGSAWKREIGENVHLKGMSKINSETCLQTCTKWERGHFAYLIGVTENTFMFVNLNDPHPDFCSVNLKKTKFVSPESKVGLGCITKERKHGLSLGIYGSPSL